MEWTDDRIRESFIYDGGEADFHDPINGAREQRRMAGEIFDAWLAAHDAEVRTQTWKAAGAFVREFDDWYGPQTIAEAIEDDIERLAADPIQPNGDQ